MYGIKGYIFFGNEKFPFENSPFEAMTGYEKGHEFVQSTIQTLELILSQEAKKEIKSTGYMFILTKERE